MRSRVALGQALLFLALTLPAAAEDDRKLSFRHDVLPVLSKAGCNGGGCHGALAGKGGFRLSLNAYDPATDHYNICLLYTSPSPRDATLSRMPSSA